jgi:type I restriction enzyme M protein
MSTITPLTYDEIRKIVWAFADMVRDKGKGTVEDYAKIVLPTCLVKRILDIQSEVIALEQSNLKSYVEDGVLTEAQAIEQISTAFPFFESTVISNASSTQSGILFISWNDLINYSDNPNGEPRTIGNPLFGPTYTTHAKTFVHLMFEIIATFNTQIQHVFKTFEFENLLLHKKIVPYQDYVQACRTDLKPSFALAYVDTDVFSDIYMDLVGRFAEDSGKKGGEFFTPQVLVKNALVFLDLDTIAKEIYEGSRTTMNIADPTAGSNTFLNMFYDMLRKKVSKLKGSSFNKNIFSFFGQELKDFQYCLGLMNMLFHGTSQFYNPGISMEHQNSNVISNYANGIGSKRGQMDIVVANPPYGLKDYGIAFATANRETDDRWKWGVPKASEGEMAFLMTIYDLLNQQGKAVIVLPLGTLFRDAGRPFRENLIRENVVEGIVALPGNMFLTTSIPVCLWILNKHKAEEDRDKVFFVNATQDFKKVGKFNEWQHKHSQENYLTRTEETDYSGYVDLATLEKNAFNLSVQRYFSKEKEKEVIDLASLAKDIKKLEGSIASNKAIMDDVFTQIMQIEGTHTDD